MYIRFLDGFRVGSGRTSTLPKDLLTDELSESPPTVQILNDISSEQVISEGSSLLLHQATQVTCEFKKLTLNYGAL